MLAAIHVIMLYSGRHPVAIFLQPRTWLFPAFILLILFPAGCSDGSISASGTVTHQGKPLEGAQVTFIPEPVSGERPIATAMTGPDGHFTLQTNLPGGKTLTGVLAGNYRVTISKFVPPKGMTEAEYQKAAEKGGGESDVYNPKAVIPERIQLIPKEYSQTASTKLTATVDASTSNTFTFDIP